MPLLISPVALLRRCAHYQSGLVHLLGAPFRRLTHERDHESHDVLIDDTKRIIRNFLNGLDFESPQTPMNSELRRRLAAEIASWNIDVSTTFTDKMLSNSCNMAETCYGHASPEHQYFIALYTAFTFYADDHCEGDPEPVGQFAHRFTNGEMQLDPVLDRFAAHIKTAYELWPLIGANTIISGTLNSMTAMYIEYTTRSMAISPSATRYPYYLRTMSGVGPPYAHFIFPKTWRASVNSYLQLIPELDYFINCTNDILSFYKESLAGETDNYVHLRAAAERKTPTIVLRELSSEVTNTVRRIKVVTAKDKELAAVWHRFLNGYLEFHIKTPRYRLKELGFYA
ncbi:Trichodiene synthase [Grifola frondosa]|uniref:Trichodiene synthase n=1 Tax=Grifola frondosa TaxID=5627 RepID=A0A1C7M4Z5_GRIFR|nr:Trichodiene synthase [Grifola frondosa]